MIYPRFIFYFFSFFQDKPNPSAPTLHGGNLPEHHFKKRYFNEEYQRQQQETAGSRDMDRAREVAREHRERDAAHAQRERDAHAQREHRQMQEQAARRQQSEYERSAGRGGPPGPPGYPGQGYEDPRAQRPGPGYNGPPRHPPPEHFRHNGPPPG